MCDTGRRTGRTSNAIKQAVFAAAFGRRVAYISATQQLADDACRFAAEYIAESLKELAVDRVIVSKDCIQFYFANGTGTGRIIFRGMDCEDTINRGIRTPEQYRIVRDHYVDEVREEYARKAARQEAQAEIVRLMKLHGFTGAAQLGIRHHIGTFINFD